METQEKTIVPRNKYTEAALKHQGSFTVNDPNFMLQTSTAMGTTLLRSNTRRKKKLTPEKDNVRNSSIKPQNKYMEAFLKHQGSFIVYDPNFML